jgi:hypothetical protein
MTDTGMFPGTPEHRYSRLTEGASELTDDTALLSTPALPAGKKKKLFTYTPRRSQPSFQLPILAGSW